MSEDNQETKITVLNPEVKKELQEMVGSTITAILKKDYRATIVHREETGGIDDSEAALIHINEETLDELGLPVELDYKGTIGDYDAFLFKETRYAMALSKLKDWRYFEQEYEENGKTYVKSVPVDLAKLMMLSKQRINMSVGGSQSWKHIKERQANAGKMEDDSFLNKVASWTGKKMERVSKEEMQKSYGNSNQK